MYFKNRFEAGEKVAELLQKYKGKAVVVAIPRGGLQVGRALADSLQCSLDCLFSKKIPLPFAEEVAIGAVTCNAFVLNKEYASYMSVSREYIETKKKQLRSGIIKLDFEYHKKASKIDLSGKTVILTDDGVATGETIEAALQELKVKKARKIVLAIPVAPLETWQKLSKKADEAICLHVAENFQAVGQFYRDFSQVTYKEAKKLLF